MSIVSLVLLNFLSSNANIWNPLGSVSVVCCFVDSSSCCLSHCVLHYLWLFAWDLEWCDIFLVLWMLRNIRLYPGHVVRFWVLLKIPWRMFVCLFVCILADRQLKFRSQVLSYLLCAEVLLSVQFSKLLPCYSASVSCTLHSRLD